MLDIKNVQKVCLHKNLGVVITIYNYRNLCEIWGFSWIH